MLLVANTSWYIYNFRLPLLRYLSSKGLDIQIIAPEDKHTASLEKEGFIVHRWNVSRRSINPWLELKAQIDLLRHYKRLKPDLVHHFTLKACLYGTLAAKATDVKHVINAVTGLGHLFLGERKRSRILRYIVKLPYKAAFSAKRSTVIFQNAADQELLISLGLVPSHQTSVIGSSGVDLNLFQPPVSANQYQNPPLLLFPSRLIREKGLTELLKAIKKLNSQGLRFKLLIAGELDSGNRSSLSPLELEQLKNQNCVELLGQIANMPALYAEIDIVVLPSWREGLSKALIEAAAMEKAIITTDVPGCREVVDHGISGLLVPPQDSEALALAIQLLLNQPELARKFGSAAREKVTKEFGVDKVNKLTYETYCKLLTLPMVDCD